MLNGEAAVDSEIIHAAYFKERGSLDVVTSEKKGNWQSMAQSAILMIEGKKATGRFWGSGLLRQAWYGSSLLDTGRRKWMFANRKEMNMGGVKDRPESGQVWDTTRGKLDGKHTAHRVYKMVSVWSMIEGTICG
jgi:hypothetical protein